MDPVTIVILDTGASISVPGNSIQAVIGVSALSQATTPANPYQIISTQNPQTLFSYLGPGPLTEAAALTCLAGGTVLAIPIPIVTKGTATAPVLTKGTNVAAGTSVVTTTLDSTNGAFDDYYVQVNVLNGGTIGTAGIQLQFSLDAGRTLGPMIYLGTATSYTIQSTGVTLNFAAGTLLTGNIIRLSTLAPSSSDANVQTALQAYKASQFAIAGVGSIHIVGVWQGSDLSLFNNGTNGYLDVLAQNAVYDRAFLTVRDASPPASWGGSGENELTWMAAITANASSTITGVNSARLCVNAGYYNTPSAYANQVAGTPSYRRPLAWDSAAKRVTVPPQRSLARVRDGTLPTIIVNPTTDPLDGFIYHDERVNSGLTTARFCAGTTRIGKGNGFFIDRDKLMSTPGSVFDILPYGSVMDVACSIVHQIGENYINDDVRLLDSGTLYPTDAINMQNEFQIALYQQMFAVNMISGSTVVVDQTNNVATTHNVNVNITLNARGYIYTQMITIGYGNGTLAGL